MDEKAWVEEVGGRVVHGGAEPGAHVGGNVVWLASVQVLGDGVEAVADLSKGSGVLLEGGWAESVEEVGMDGR